MSFICGASCTSSSEAVYFKWGFDFLHHVSHIFVRACSVTPVSKEIDGNSIDLTEGHSRCISSTSEPLDWIDELLEPLDIWV